MLARVFVRLAFSIRYQKPINNKNINNNHPPQSTIHPLKSSLQQHLQQPPIDNPSSSPSSHLTPKPLSIPTYRIKLNRISQPNYLMQVINNDHTLKQTNKLLHAIANGGSGVSIGNFQSIFKKYCYYVQKVVDKNGYAQASFEEKVQFLDGVTLVYEKMGNLISAHMTKTFNKVSSQLYKQILSSISLQKGPTKQQLQSLFHILVCISRYNHKKSYALYKSLQKRLHSQKYLSKIDKNTSLLILQHFHNLKSHNRLLTQLSIDTLLPHIPTLPFPTISLILQSLSTSQIPVLKQFTINICERIHRQNQKLVNISNGDMYFRSRYEMKEMLRVIEWLSVVQVKMNLASAYLEEVTRVVEEILFVFGRELGNMDDGDLEKFCHIIRRVCYYDQAMLAALTAQLLSRPIKQLQQLDTNSQDTPKPNQKSKHISINTLSSALHCLAVYRYRDQPLISYYIKCLKLLSQKEQYLSSTHPSQNQQQHIHSYSNRNQSTSKLNKTSKQLLVSKLAYRGGLLKRGHIMNGKYYSRVVWALCVLADKQELAQAYPIIQPYFNKLYEHQNTSPPLHESLNFYYSYLLLKTYFTPKQLNFPKIIKHLQNQNLHSQISQTHHKIYQTFISSGIPALKQYNISNLMCDIFIPKYITGSHPNTHTHTHAHTHAHTRTQKSIVQHRQRDGGVEEQRYVIQNLVIDVHGKHHFMRNCDQVKGSGWLKCKILENQGCVYQYIGVEEWALIQDKEQFVRDFVQRVAKNYGVKYEEDKVQHTIGSSSSMVQNRSQQPQITKLQMPQKSGRRIKTNSPKLQLQINSPKHKI